MRQSTTQYQPFVEGSSAARSLADLRSLADIQAENVRLFPSMQSLRWALRKYRSKLTEQGAIVVIAGRIYIDRQPFEAAMLAIGKEESRGKRQRDENS